MRLFLAVALCRAALAATAPASPPPDVDETAALLAGRDVPQQSPLARVAKSGAARLHREKIREMFGRFSERVLVPMRAWRDRNVGDAPTDTVLYPFSGVDALTSLTLYPKAHTYVHLSLEHGGPPPDLTRVPAADLNAALDDLRHGVRGLMSIGYSATNTIERELDAGKLKGLTPALIMELGLLDCRVHAVEPVTIDDTGALHVGPGKGPEVWEGYSDVQIRFSCPGPGVPGEQRIVHLSGDAGDKGLVHREATVKFLKSLGRVSVVLKSASYLLQMPHFERMKALLLDQAALVVQDASGLPYKAYAPATWKVSIFGNYVHAWHVFKWADQPELARRFATEPHEKLPFPFGYQNSRTENAILVARRLGN